MPRDDTEVAPILGRMRLRCGDAIQLMRQWEEAVPQVIYLDPMFPHRDKVRWSKGNAPFPGLGG